MAKITSLNDPRKIKDDLQEKIRLRENAESPESMVQIKVGMATSGIASGAKEIFNYLVEELEKLTGQKIDDLHKHFMDKVEIPSANGNSV